MKNKFVSQGVIDVTTERYEQVFKHGFDVRNDQYYSAMELRSAAMYALTLENQYWPNNWNTVWRDKITKKTVEQRMAVAGAFCCAEIDRLKQL